MKTPELGRHRIREIDHTSTREIDLIAQRMRLTLLEVLGEKTGGSMYTMDWLKQRVMFHLDPAQSTAQIFLAEECDEFFGHCIVRIDHDDSGKEIGLFSTTYVAPDFRRLGIADALLIRGEQWMIEHGMTEALTYTSDSNTKLINLYRKHGYEVTVTDAEKQMIGMTKILAGIERKSGLDG
jgi:GNAT superfamily N-acetyltransferase